MSTAVCRAFQYCNWTLKFKVQSKNPFFCYLQSNIQRLLPASDCYWTLFHCLNFAQGFYNHVLSSCQLGEPANIWLTVARKTPFVGWALRPRHTMRQIAATCRRHRLLQQIASCDKWKSLSLRSVAQIQTGLNSCDISQRQNKGKRLVAATVQTWRLIGSTCRCDLSHCVSRPLNFRVHMCYWKAQ